MALVVNTNIPSLIVQKNLNSATNSLNNAIERMTTGYKINHAKDNAAGYSIATNWEAQLSSLDVAAENAATGLDLLTTLEDNYALISSHIQRVRDLTEQAANGTYGTESLAAIKEEITARLNEVDRIAGNCEFNGRKLMAGETTAGTPGKDGINLQVGINSDTNSRIALSNTLFAKADTVTLFTGVKKGDSAKTALTAANATVAKVAEACSSANASDMLAAIDEVMKKISTNVTTIGAAANRVESAQETINVQIENISSSLSTLKDADVAKESSNYIKAQILQQASATLLSTANQAPSIALNLL